MRLGLVMPEDTEPPVWDFNGKENGPVNKPAKSNGFMTTGKTDTCCNV